MFFSYYSSYYIFAFQSRLFYYLVCIIFTFSIIYYIDGEPLRTFEDFPFIEVGDPSFSWEVGVGRKFGGGHESDCKNENEADIEPDTETETVTEQTAQNTEEETTKTPETTSGSATQQSTPNTGLIIGIICGAAAVAAVVLIIVIVSKKKK